jgi:ABC-type transport system involved in cytochrome bd biosynthesis fused ATPase/permease subunit
MSVYISIYLKVTGSSFIQTALFQGSVRSNLDPLLQHSDIECWNVLQRCNLADGWDSSTGSSRERTGLVKSLDMQVSAGGSSFSAGQRQMLALARAMLRGSSFIILDEASSSIDLATDDQVSLLHARYPSAHPRGSDSKNNSGRDGSFAGAHYCTSSENNTRYVNLRP